MKLPCSAKTLFRIHRKIFMLRRPCLLVRNAYCLTLTPGKKTPTVSLRVERGRGLALTAVLFVLGLILAYALPSGDR